MAELCKDWTRTLIPLTDRVWGPYHKLRPEFFPLWFMAQAQSARAINERYPWSTLKLIDTRSTLNWQSINTSADTQSTLHQHLCHSWSTVNYSVFDQCIWIGQHESYFISCICSFSFCYHLKFQCWHDVTVIIFTFRLRSVAFQVNINPDVDRVSIEMSIKGTESMNTRPWMS